MTKAKIFNYILFALLFMMTMTIKCLYGDSVIFVIIAVATGMSLGGIFWLEEASE